jgi:hypothetical protein
VRTGSTREEKKFSAPDPLASSWKPVTESPNFLLLDSPKYDPNVDVADITDAMGETRLTMTYDFHSAQCRVWALDGLDLSYASAA